MDRLSARTGGTAVVLVGLALAAVHLRAVAALRDQPALMLVEALLPLGLALLITAVGASMREEVLVPPEFAERTLAWAAVGALTLGAATGGMALDAMLRGQALPAMPQTLFNAVTLGTLVGLVIGIYDARGRHQRRRTAQLTRINDTLRIATQEIVNATDRNDLEQTVCDRLTESDLYDSAWIGRYDPDEQVVRPSAWAGHDDAYIDSLEVTTDPDDPKGQGPGGKAIRTREIQPVQDVFEEPSLEPWWEMLTEKGVEAMAVVPLVGEEDVYGFLSVYANRANVFDERERAALSELGESIGHAIDSITAREQLAKREAELARQNERLDEFASVISHDLRNPLNVVQGNIDLVQETGDTDYLDRAADALDRMDELIDDVLTLAREGRTVSEFRPVDLGSVAERAWTTTDTGAASLEFADDLGRVRGDESRLVQVFENLFRNSVEHGSTDSRPQADDSVEHGSTSSRPQADTAAGGAPDETTASFRRGGRAADADAEPAVTITVGRLDDGFYVADDGPGIPEGEREQVFDTGYSTAPGGTGLGLNIVRSIAEAHGWQVDVTESDAGGARFEFTGVESAESA
ncbi:MAG: GAF domain-containing protein [Haloplanus sp.]